MPTISQLPAAEVVTSSDEVPVSQGGVARSATIGSILGSTQPAIIVESGMLLGRVSLGPGGPEGITVGTGLILNAATLQATGADFASFAHAADLDPTGSVVVSNSDATPKLMEISQLRGLFSAGTDIAISASGVISASVEIDSSNAVTFGIGTLPSATAASAQDLVAISQAGTAHAIAYSALINGQTIDAAQPAGTASDGDSLWVSQGSSTMVRQTLSAIWPWIESKLVTFKTPNVEISTNTTVDGTVHNARVLICSQPVTLTAISTNLSPGFCCEIINLSAGLTSFSGSITTSTGALALTPGQAATLRCLNYSAGTILYAVIEGAAATGSVPGQISNLESGNQGVNSVTLSWSAPTSGSGPTGYIVEYRLTGTANWSIFSQTVVTPSCTVTGLSSNASYDFRVYASNASGSGISSAALTIPTSSSGGSPGNVGAFAVGGLASASVVLTWQAPSLGSEAASYTVQYRPSGGVTWVGTISGIAALTATVTGLTPSTAYDFSVYAVNANGSGPISQVLAASTTTPTNSVTSVVWNVVPSGSYTHGSGVIGVNAHVTPPTATVQFGFSASASSGPSSWTVGVAVNTDLWGTYIPTPPTAGTWYAWAAGTDGSAATVFATPFTVT